MQFDLTHIVRDSLLFHYIIDIFVIMDFRELIEKKEFPVNANGELLAVFGFRDQENYVDKSIEIAKYLQRGSGEKLLDDGIAWFLKLVK